MLTGEPRSAGPSPGWAARTGIAIALLITLLTGTGIGDAPGIANAGTFRHRHADLADLAHDELPWTSERAPLLPTRPPRDRHGVPMMRWTDGRDCHLDAARLVFRSFRRTQRVGHPWVSFVDRAR
jgi:hypothetical protein